ncbi:MAG: PadR family transcriptional regulator [Promethearchaeota archaeon]
MMQEDISKYYKKMRRSFSHFIILSILNADDAEIHGYELKKRIEAEFGDTKEFFETDSSIYPVLTDLRKKGLLDFKERIVSGRTQKLYYITDKGKELLPEMERQYMYFNSKIRNFFTSLAESFGLKVSFQINMEDLEGEIDDKLLNLTLIDLKQKIMELPTKELKRKCIKIIDQKLNMLQKEVKKLEKNLKLL